MLTHIPNNKKSLDSYRSGSDNLLKGIYETKKCNVGEKQFMEVLQTSVFKGCCDFSKGTRGGCLTTALATVRVTVQGFLQVWVQIRQWKLQRKIRFFFMG